MTNNFKNYTIVALSVLLILAAYFLIKARNEIKKHTEVEMVEEKEIPDTTKAISKGRIVIIIDDFGYRNDKISDGFLELEEDITFAVIPGQKYSSLFAEKAANEGFEIIVHMPMESKVSELREEPYSITTKMTSLQIEEKLTSAFEIVPQAIGMNNHQGSMLTEDLRAMAVVGSFLKTNKKYFIDSRTTSGSIAEDQMVKLGVPVAVRRIFLDNDLDPDLISKQLDKLAYWADRRGRAIGIGHAKQTTLEVIKREIPRLKAQGYVFSFASTAVE